MEAAGVLVLSEQSLVLAVSRGRNRDDLGLPFGDVDPGDINLGFTAARELLEETGVVVAPFDLAPIFSAVSVTGTYATTFVPHHILQWPRRLKSQPFEGYVTWAEPCEMVTAHCTFAAYQRALFTKLEIPYR